MADAGTCLADAIHNSTSPYQSEIQGWPDHLVDMEQRAAMAGAKAKAEVEAEADDDDIDWDGANDNVRVELTSATTATTPGLFDRLSGSASDAFAAATRAGAAVISGMWLLIPAAILLFPSPTGGVVS